MEDDCKNDKEVEKMVTYQKNHKNANIQKIVKSNTSKHGIILLGTKSSKN